MELEKVTDLSYTERTILAEFRLCSETDKAKIRAQMQTLLAENDSKSKQTVMAEKDITK